MEMSGKHKYPEKTRVWKREENMGKLGKKWRKQQPDPTVEDEWRRYQIKGENGKKMREQEGEQLPGSAVEDDWRREQIRWGENGKWVKE